MIFDYKVKHNGKYYEAGEEVPIKGSLSPDEENAKFPFSDSEIEMETKDHKYTYEELEQMTAKEMRRLAEDKGFRLTKTIRDDLINEFLSKQ